MSFVTEGLKILKVWRDWLADIGTERQTATLPIGGDASPESDDEEIGVPASCRIERNLYIYGLPPM